MNIEISTEGITIDVNELTGSYQDFFTYMNGAIPVRVDIDGAVVTNANTFDPVTHEEGDIIIIDGVEQ